MTSLSVYKKTAVSGHSTSVIQHRQYRCGFAGSFSMENIFPSRGSHFLHTLASASVCHMTLFPFKAINARSLARSWVRKAYSCVMFAQSRNAVSNAFRISELVG